MLEGRDLERVYWYWFRQIIVEEEWRVFALSSQFRSHVFAWLTFWNQIIYTEIYEPAS